MRKLMRLQRIFPVLSMIRIGALAFQASRIRQGGSLDPLVVAGPPLGLVASVGSLAVARDHLRRIGPATGALRPRAASGRAE